MPPEPCHHPHAPRRTVVLVGAGHASLQVLERWPRPAPRDVELVLVSDRPAAYYSGMVPGWVAGEYGLADLTIPLAPLAERCGARFIQAPAQCLDPVSRSVTLEGGDTLGYDLALLDCGSTTSGLDIPGVREYALPARPIGGFIEAFRALSGRRRVAVVGGGPGGLELAFALAGSHEVALVERAERLLPGSGPGASPAVTRQATQVCQERDIPVLLGSGVSRVDGAGLQLSDGRSIEADLVVWTTGAASTALVDRSPLPRGPNGFVPVRETLQVVGHDDLLVAGDAAAWTPDLAKAGVHAVRAGPVALHNLVALLRDRPLRAFRPQRDFLALLNAADGTAIATKWGFVARGRWVRRLKHRIDRGWVARFQASVPSR